MGLKVKLQDNSVADARRRVDYNLEFLIGGR